MSWLIQQAGENVDPEKVIVVGMSRGGVQAVVFANCLKKRFPKTRVFVFTIDPVQGYHLRNDGSFDMRDDRKGSAGSRDRLKAAYNLSDQAPNTIPDNVVMYLSVLSQFRGSQRGVSWGFTPQSPTLGNMTMTNPDQAYQLYELPGDHSSGVHSGKKNAGQYHDHHISRAARSMATWDMFSHWLLRKDFARVERPWEWYVLDAYCHIANQDLGGVQFDGKNSGFSFLRASRTMSAHNFDQTAASRTLKGRGHLIASSQVAKSEREHVGLQGYYVNQRHFDVYVILRDALRNELKNSSRSAILKKCNEIEPWVQHNSDGFHGRQFG